MADFVLITDDSCDLPMSYYTENGIGLVKLGYSLEGEVYRQGDVTEKEFYDLIRSGKKPTTIAVNAEDAIAVIEPHLQNGEDVLYIAFSSGLSASYNNAEMGAVEMREKYPDRKIIVVDTLCASLGQGLLLHKVKGMRDKGASIEAAAKWAEDNKLNVAHNVMADDLYHLHRGGRVSKTSAVMGTMLGVKPIIHVNNEGKLVAIGKVRGKKQALTNIVDRMEKLVGNTPNDFFTVCHADAIEDAEFVAKLMSERFKIDDYIINYIGPVIGSHTGTGTIAIFMMAEHR
jgi:DegV family protein with EDD domain